MAFPQRRSIRLTEYDYHTPGGYFITICTHQRLLLLARPECAETVTNVWSALPEHYVGVSLDAFVVMPDHVHGIIFLNGGDGDNERAGFKPARSGGTPALSEVVRGFKTFSARKINALRGLSGAPVWQRSYYEHVIRNEDDLEEIQSYIVGNPLKWEHDHDGLGMRAGFKPAPTATPLAYP